MSNSQISRAEILAQMQTEEGYDIKAPIPTFKLKHNTYFTYDTVKNPTKVRITSLTPSGKQARVFISYRKEDGSIRVTPWDRIHMVHIYGLIEKEIEFLENQQQLSLDKK
jgi:hypothetical protein